MARFEPKTLAHIDRYHWHKSNRYIHLRNRKGFSQEELSEKTGLSLRTVQRVENGETEPRGDTLKRLALAFGVSADEIVDWTVQEDKGLLTSLNLSALSFIFFPILGILVPLIIWISKKDKIKNVNKVARDLLNFEITWNILLYAGSIGIIINMTTGNLNLTGDISPTVVSSWISSQLLIIILFFGLMYLYNLIFIIVNTIRINKDSKVCYRPKIGFLR